MPKPELRPIESNGDARSALKGTRDVDFDELGRHESRIFERALLGAGAELEGPAVIEEPAASTVVFPGQQLRVDELGNLIVELRWRADGDDCEDRARPIHRRDRQGLAGGDRGRDVRRASTHLEEHDHLRGAWTSPRA